MAKKRFEDDNTEIENTAIYENLLDARFTLLWRHDGQTHRTAALTSLWLPPAHFIFDLRNNATVNSLDAAWTWFIQAIIFVLFLPFPARDPLVHDIIANFQLTNHIRSRWRNRLIRQLSVWSGRSQVSRFKPRVSYLFLKLIKIFIIADRTRSDPW